MELPDLRCSEPDLYLQAKWKKIIGKHVKIVSIMLFFIKCGYYFKNKK